MLNVNNLLLALLVKISLCEILLHDVYIFKRINFFLFKTRFSQSDRIKLTSIISISIILFSFHSFILYHHFESRGSLVSGRSFLIIQYTRAT